ncbi:MAG: MFS transporter [Nostoc desertorum CM1-VF14]|jgi:EmrB/QacA subfamily drug resistance transporter|nr:MFS transporter [Nostoc desertorum CM1-VF14]
MNQARVKAMTLAAMCFALFMSNTDDTSLNVALPSIQASLGSHVSGLQWIINANTLPAVSLALPSGALGDNFGRKRVFLTALVIYTFASILCGFAPSLGILISGRFIQGIGAAALVPTSLSILGDTFPDPKEKAKAIGIWSAVSGIALIAGPALGGVFVDIWGWQSIFFFNVPVGAIAFVLTCRVVRESKKLTQQHLDVPGLLFSIIFLASLTYAIIESNNLVWHSPLIVLLLTIVGFSLIAFLVVESRSSHPMLPLELFKNQTFAVVNFVSVLVFFTFLSLLFIFSLFLQQVQGYSATVAGLCFVPLNAAFVIASLASGWLAARFGWRYVIAAGLTMGSVVTLSFIRANADTEYATVMWNLVLSGFGSGLAVSPLAAAAMSSAPPAKGGIASAILNASNLLGGLLGIAFIGTILAQRLTSDLARSLSAWGLPANIQEKLVADALRGKANIPNGLASNISEVALHQAISNAFVSGLHTALLVASAALLVGAFLVLAFVQPTFNQATKNSHLSTVSKREGGKFWKRVYKR